jgi:hypothetical protein
VVHTIPAAVIEYNALQRAQRQNRERVPMLTPAVTAYVKSLPVKQSIFDFRCTRSQHVHLARFTWRRLVADHVPLMELSPAALARLLPETDGVQDMFDAGGRRLGAEDDFAPRARNLCFVLHQHLNRAMRALRPHWNVPPAFIRPSSIMLFDYSEADECFEVRLASSGARVCVVSEHDRIRARSGATGSECPYDEIECGIRPCSSCVLRQHCVRGRFTAVRRCLDAQSWDQGLPTEARTGWTLLHVAALHVRLPVMTLLARYVDVAQRDTVMQLLPLEVLLIRACVRSTRLPKELLETLTPRIGADADAPDASGATLHDYAAFAAGEFHSQEVFAGDEVYSTAHRWFDSHLPPVPVAGQALLSSRFSACLGVGRRCDMRRFGEFVCMGWCEQTGALNAIYDVTPSRYVRPVLLMHPASELVHAFVIYDMPVLLRNVLIVHPLHVNVLLRGRTLLHTAADYNRGYVTQLLLSLRADSGGGAPFSAVWYAALTSPLVLRAMLTHASFYPHLVMGRQEGSASRSPARAPSDAAVRAVEARVGGCTLLHAVVLMLRLLSLSNRLDRQWLSQWDTDEPHVALCECLLLFYQDD